MIYKIIQIGQQMDSYQIYFLYEEQNLLLSLTKQLQNEITVESGVWGQGNILPNMFHFFAINIIFTNKLNIRSNCPCPEISWGEKLFVTENGLTVGHLL